MTFSDLFSSQFPISSGFHLAQDTQRLRERRRAGDGYLHNSFSASACGWRFLPLSISPGADLKPRWLSTGLLWALTRRVKFEQKEMETRMRRLDPRLFYSLKCVSPFFSSSLCDHKSLPLSLSLSLTGQRACAIGPRAPSQINNRRLV